MPTTLTPSSSSSSFTQSLISFSRILLSPFPHPPRPYPLQLQSKALTFSCPRSFLPVVGLLVAGPRAVRFSSRAFDDSG
ncbi:hypothetical protein MLD38_025032 [Melastoma candidum]|uniref:Uncharacterized protein n=1 Tax=Melastoma candidum TaxID=119954 RepID=A0ACB9NU24_9MYRT|nr:hypothetical protein MLD38_025032 [Melastoma candidum]